MAFGALYLTKDAVIWDTWLSGEYQELFPYPDFEYRIPSVLLCYRESYAAAAL